MSRNSKCSLPPGRHVLPRIFPRFWISAVLSRVLSKHVLVNHLFSRRLAVVLLVSLLSLPCGRCGSVIGPAAPDPDMAIQPDNQEDMFVFPSMKMGMMSVDDPRSAFVHVTYRGEPPQPKINQPAEPLPPPQPLQVVVKNEAANKPTDRSIGLASVIHAMETATSSSETTVAKPVTTMATVTENARTSQVTTPSPAGLELTPGSGSWNYNSIVATARAGLPAKHVPLQDPELPDDLDTGASERIQEVEVTNPPPIRVREENRARHSSKGGRRRENSVRKPNLAAVTHVKTLEGQKTVHGEDKFQKMLTNLEDYREWLKMKENYIRENRELFNIQQSAGKDVMLGKIANKVEKAQHTYPKENILELNKFPNFPDRSVANNPSNDLSETRVARPERNAALLNSDSTLPVFMEGNTLYRAPEVPELERTKLHEDRNKDRTFYSDGSTLYLTSPEKVPNSLPKKTPFEVAQMAAEGRPEITLPPAVKVSSLPTRHPGLRDHHHHHVSPVNQMRPTPIPAFYTSPPPPLPPGYELIPINQLTPEHEVVPWDELPNLMAQHNLTVNNIPLGPFHHSTTAPSPLAGNPTLTPKPYFSHTTSSPYHSTTKASIFTTKIPKPTHTKEIKPFVNFPLKSNPLAPFIPPPISQDMGGLVSSGIIDNSLYSPKHGLPSKDQPSDDIPVDVNGRPKSIHFGTDFNNQEKYKYNPQDHKEKSQFRYDPTISSSEISVAKDKIFHQSTSPTPTPFYQSTFSMAPKIYSTTLATLKPNYFPIGSTYRPSPAPQQTLHINNPKSIKPFHHFTSTYLPQTYSITPSTAFFSLTPTIPTVETTPYPIITTHSTHPHHQPQAVTTAHPIYHRGPVTTNRLSLFSTGAPSLKEIGTIPPPTQRPLSILPPPMPKVIGPPHVQPPRHFEKSSQELPASVVKPTAEVMEAVDNDRKNNNNIEFPAENLAILGVEGKQPEAIQTKSTSLVFPNSVLRKTESGKSQGLQIEAVNSGEPVRKQSSITTSQVAVLRPEVAVPSITLMDDESEPKFQHFPMSNLPESKSQPLQLPKVDDDKPKNLFQSIDLSQLQQAGKRDKNDLRNKLIALTTMKPELLTKPNDQKMRSSTTLRSKNFRSTVRPPLTNFHPIEEKHDPPSIEPPQARPNVPISETNFQPELPKFRNHPEEEATIGHSGGRRRSNITILANNNQGLWLLEEKLNPTESEKNPKREFGQIRNPNIDSPSSLFSKERVSVVETSKSGEVQRLPESKTIESTTFSTSRVEMHVSTTPSTVTSPRSFETTSTEFDANRVLKRLRGRIRQKQAQKRVRVHSKGVPQSEETMETASTLIGIQTDSSLTNSIDNKDQLEQLMKERRRQLRQRAKALMSAMEEQGQEPFVVLPIRQVDPNSEIDVDKMFDPKSHPGIKRISAYEFEELLANNASVMFADNKIPKPMSDLKSSIEDLTDTMNNLSTTVKESTTAKTESTDVTRDTIAKLQMEIAKLTQVIETLKITKEDDGNAHFESELLDDGVTMKGPGDDYDLAEDSDTAVSVVNSLRQDALLPGFRTEPDGPLAANRLDSLQSNRLQELPGSHSEKLLQSIESESKTTTTEDISKFFSNPHKSMLSDKGDLEDYDYDDLDHGFHIGDDSSFDDHGILGLFEQISKMKPEAQQNFMVKKLKNNKNISPALIQTLQSKMDEIEKKRKEEEERERKEEERRLAEERQKEEDRILEQQRKMWERLQEERKRIEEEKERKRIEQELERKEEERKKAEEIRREIERQFEMERQLEEERKREEKERLEELRQQEELRLLQEQKKKEDEEEKRRQKLEEMRKLLQEETLRKQREEQQKKYEELQDTLRKTNLEDMKRAEEELRREQREKIKKFNLERLFDDQKQFLADGIKQQREITTPPTTLRPTNSPSPATSGWTRPVWVSESEQAPKPERPGMAVASIVIEDVGASTENINGIIRAAGGASKDSMTTDKFAGDSNDIEIPNWSEGPLYDYEYYEADVDEIEFPVSATLGSGHGNADSSINSQQDGLPESLNKLSNKELLLRLLKESNNFQNQEFLSKLKEVVMDKASEEGVELGEAGHGTIVPMLDNGGGWSPASAARPLNKLISSLEDKPIWPTRSNLLPSQSSSLGASSQAANTFNTITSSSSGFGGASGSNVVSNNFAPSSPVRFPAERRSDGGLSGGVGEVSLVTGPQAALATSIAGFQQSHGSPSRNEFSQGQVSPYQLPATSDLASKVDVSSGQEFLVGTSFSLGAKGRAREYSEPETQTKHQSVQGFGTITPIKVGGSLSFDSGPTATPGYGYSYAAGGGQSGWSGGSPSATSTSSKYYGQPSTERRHDYGQGSVDAQYFFDSHDRTSIGGGSPLDSSQVFTDIRLEPGKKNLLGLSSVTTDASSHYIMNTEADRLAGGGPEVIVYPMGQLLGRPQGPSPPPRIGSYSRLLPTTILADSLASATGDNAGTEDEIRYGEAPSLDDSAAPQGFLQTIMRSARDDLKIVGNVFKHLTGSS